MREARRFGERSRVLSSDVPKSKYFLICEGRKTERIYFEAVDSARDLIGIDPLIEIVPVVRSYSEEGWSNPKKLHDRLSKILKETADGKPSYRTLLDAMSYIFQEFDVLPNTSERVVWEMMRQVLEGRLRKSLDDTAEDLETDAVCILKECAFPGALDNLVSLIRAQSEFVYAEDLDTICLITDRDKDSFTSEQYEYVMSKCADDGFDFYVTNPCFEFWLLLHFDEVFELDHNRLLENEKVSSGRRYADDELRKLLGSYRKSAYKADKLVKDIDKAIENEKAFCEDAVGLKDNVGSNIGLLIGKMRGRKSNR